MKRENGFGCVFKLGGKRRKPYAVRVTVGFEDGKQKTRYISYHETKEAAEAALIAYRAENNIVSANHYMHDTIIYRKWWGMIQRCKNEKHYSYKWYGARGIKVCDEWRKSFKAFYAWAIANGYKDGLTIDRIDNDGNYCPENCRWVTRSEQAKNHYHSGSIELLKRKHTRT